MAITLPGVDRAYLGRVYKKKNIGPDPSTLNIETFKEARIESIRREISDKQGKDIRATIISRLPQQYQKTMAQFKEEERKIEKRYPGQRRSRNHAVNAMRQQNIIQAAQVADPGTWGREVEVRARDAYKKELKARGVQRDELRVAEADRRKAAIEAGKTRRETFNKLQKMTPEQAAKAAESARKTTAQSRATSRKSRATSGLTPSVQERKAKARSNLNQAEAAMRNQIANDPEKATLLEEYMDKVNNTPASDFEDLFADAAKKIDDYFEVEERQLKEQLGLKLRQINEDSGDFNDREMKELKTKIDHLHFETAMDLSENIDDMQRKGLMGSGIAKRAADIIMHASSKDEATIRQQSEFDIRDQLREDRQYKERLEMGFDIEQTQLQRDRKRSDLISMVQMEEERQGGIAQSTEPEARTFFTGSDQDPSQLPEGSFRPDPSLIRDFAGVDEPGQTEFRFGDRTAAFAGGGQQTTPNAFGQPGIDPYRFINPASPGFKPSPSDVTRSQRTPSTPRSSGTIFYPGTQKREPISTTARNILTGARTTAGQASQSRTAARRAARLAHTK